MTLAAIAISVVSILAIWAWINRNYKSNLKPDDVAALLQSLLSNELSSEAWDYFISVEFSDRQLEAIRQTMCDMWTVNSEFMEAGEMSPCKLNARGREKVRELISECKRLQIETTAT